MEEFGGVFAFGSCLVSFALIIILVILTRGIRIIYQYERGVIFTLGKYGGTRNPGSPSSSHCSVLAQS
jgi:regulator of protease activity HflC (stomatin/prohibitin superfamily)